MAVLAPKHLRLVRLEFLEQRLHQAHSQLNLDLLALLVRRLGWQEQRPLLTQLELVHRLVKLLVSYQQLVLVLLRHHRPEQPYQLLVQLLAFVFDHLALERLALEYPSFLLKNYLFYEVIVLDQTTFCQVAN